MRDIISLIDNLAESTGLANRNPGDVFLNTKGEEITFDEITFFPPNGGKYEPEQLVKVLLTTERKYPNIEWLNKRTAKTGGFAIISFDSDKGPVYMGRYLEQIKPNKTDNYISNSVGDYAYGGKAAAKVQSKLTPQDLLEKRTNLTPAGIVKQLANSLGTNNPLYVIAYKVASGEGPPLDFAPPPGVSFTGFRDYFCEILQPMALITGKYTGNAGKAAEIFLDGTFENCTITFDDSKNAGLSDSILTNPQGKSVKVSTKGGKGAQASTKNLVDSIDELQSSTIGRKLMKTYKEVIDLMREVQRLGQVGAPLFLGVKYDIISDKEADIIRNLRNTAPINLKNLDKIKLTPNLKKLALARTTDDPTSVNLFYHLIATLAAKAADKVNNETNFSKAAADILNNGALVQVYTKAKEGKSTWELRGFETFYPDDNIKGVYFSSSKNYMSTQIKGNFTFLIDKGSDKPKKETNADPNYGGEQTPAVDLAKDSKKVVNTKLLKRTKRKTAVAPDVGREKRKR
jgi:hypothetical protein